MSEEIDPKVAWQITRQLMQFYRLEALVRLYEFTGGRPFFDTALTDIQLVQLNILDRQELIAYLRQEIQTGDYILLRQVGRKLRYDWVVRPTHTPKGLDSPFAPYENQVPPTPTTEAEAIALIHERFRRHDRWVRSDDVRRVLSRRTGWENVTVAQVDLLLFDEVRCGRLNKQQVTDGAGTIALYRHPVG